MFGVHGLGFGAWSKKFGVLGFGVVGSGFWFLAMRFRFLVIGFLFGVWNVGGVQGLPFSDLGFTL